MLTFNHVLSAYDVQVDLIQLVRHQDTSAIGRTPYDLLREDLKKFECYQSVQKIHPTKKGGGFLFDIGNSIASFVVDFSKSTLFAGLYEVLDCCPCPPTDICPLRGLPHGLGCHSYVLRRNSALDELAGRLTIDWGPGARSWVQRARRQQKRVVEIRQRFSEPPFPGFLHFRGKTNEISSLPIGWKEALRSARGVYLLVDSDDGRQYIGSATGHDGFLGRFFDYEKDGHGGNVMLKAANKKEYHVSILEVAGTNLTTNDIIRLESLWKHKLGTRAFGLNAG